MPGFVALLRGVNVGGGTVLPMADFRAALEELGARDVATHIRSGNAVFRSGAMDRPARDGFARALSSALVLRGGSHPECLILAGSAFEAACAANPFPEANAAPKSLHFFFCDPEPGASDLAAWQRLAAESEALAQLGPVLCLHAPQGIGRSKLAVDLTRRVEGRFMTARNLATCMALVGCLRALPACSLSGQGR